MNFDEYQRDAARTTDVTRSLKNRLANAALGLAGEAGEFVDMAKKWLYHGHPIDHEAAAKELGDVLWYVAEACTVLGLDLEDVAERNIEKLRARYPDGFSEERSRNRTD